MLCTAVMAQTHALDEGEPDSTIDVISYFNKGDTATYTVTTKKWTADAEDTTVAYNIVEQIQLVVTDSTSEGYTIEYTPISLSVTDGEERPQGIMMKAMWDIFKDVKPLFTIDEYGSITHLTNWRDIRDRLKKASTIMFDSLYSDAPELDSIMPRSRLKALTAMQYRDENSILEAYEEMQTLFGLHGLTFNVGTKETTDSTSYPSKITAVSQYEDYGDEFSYDGDFSIKATTVTTIPNEEAKELLAGVLGLTLTDTIASQVNEVFSQALEGDMTITQLEDYHYFYNGWPRLMRKQKIVRAMNHVNVEETTIEWDKMHWAGNAQGSSEEPKVDL